MITTETKFFFSRPHFAPQLLPRLHINICFMLFFYFFVYHFFFPLVFFTALVFFLLAYVFHQCSSHFPASPAAGEKTGGLTGKGLLTLALALWSSDLNFCSFILCFILAVTSCFSGSVSETSFVVLVGHQQHKELTYNGRQLVRQAIVYSRPVAQQGPPPSPNATTNWATQLSPTQTPSTEHYEGEPIDIRTSVVSVGDGRQKKVAIR